MPDKLVFLIRHGESDWNRDNRFTGWTDVDLSRSWPQEEAAKGGRLLKEQGFADLRPGLRLRAQARAIRTLWIVLDEMDLMWLPVHATIGRLNERHYGRTSGLE